MTDLRGLVQNRAGARVGLRIQGLGVDGSEEAARIRELGKRALPAYPGEGVIKPVVVPPPPLLPAITSLTSYRVCAEMLAAVYRGALLDRFDLSSYFGFPDIQSNQATYIKLCKVVDLMTLYEIPPAAWVLFSFDVWKQYGATGGPPTVAWTFSAPRLTEKRDWFAARRDEYFGGRTYFSEEHLALVQRWRRMWERLMSLRPQTRVELLAVVDEFFPGDSYEKAVEAAQVSSRRLEQYLREAIEDGRMVWG